MNSAVYLGKLVHVRSKPKQNAFTYRVFMLFLDLDELDELDRRFRLFSRNRLNVFGFHDRGHFKFLWPKSETASVIAQEHVKYDVQEYRKLKDTKARVIRLLKDAGQDFDVGRVCLLTNPRVFGYVFNPVSFYYCFDTKGVFRVLLSEVNNTFGDQKMYLYEAKDPQAKFFATQERKNFYISPFIDHDNELVWQFSLPEEKLLMVIDSQEQGESELKATFSGERRELSGQLLASLIFRYPLLTLMIIFRIHYQALRLFLKKIRFRDKKNEDQKIAKDIRHND